MTIQKIMVPFQAADTGALSFQAGATLARQFKAHVDVVHIRRRTPLPAGYYYPIAGAYIPQDMDAAAAGATKLADELKVLHNKLCQEYNIAHLEKSAHDESLGATAEWSDLNSNFSYDFANRARLADLTVVAKPAGKLDPDHAALVEELIFQSARPVLVAAGAKVMKDFPKTVVVAWDGGREAARAISTTLPLLKEAETVFVTSIGEIKAATEPAERAAAYLRLHGVHALHNHPASRKGQSPEEQLLEYAESKAADMIVMGAYSHNRWREVVMGGFTRHILNHADLPVVLTH